MKKKGNVIPFKRPAPRTVDEALVHLRESIFGMDKKLSAPYKPKKKKAEKMKEPKDQANVIQLTVPDRYMNGINITDIADKVISTLLLEADAVTDMSPKEATLDRVTRYAEAEKLLHEMDSSLLVTNLNKGQELEESGFHTGRSVQVAFAVLDKKDADKASPCYIAWMGMFFEQEEDTDGTLYIDREWVTYSIFEKWYKRQHQAEGVTYALSRLALNPTGRRQFSEKTCCLIPVDLMDIWTDPVTNVKVSPAVAVVKGKPTQYQPLFRGKPIDDELWPNACDARAVAALTASKEIKMLLEADDRIKPTLTNKIIKANAVTTASYITTVECVGDDKLKVILFSPSTEVTITISCILRESSIECIYPVTLTNPHGQRVKNAVHQVLARMSYNVVIIDRSLGL